MSLSPSIGPVMRAVTYEHEQAPEPFFESVPQEAHLQESPHLQSALEVHEQDVTLSGLSL